MSFMKKSLIKKTENDLVQKQASKKDEYFLIKKKMV